MKAQPGNWPVPKPALLDESEWMAVQVLTTFHGASHDSPQRHLLASALKKLVAFALRSERTPIPCRWCQQDSCYCCPECGHDVRVDHDRECPTIAIETAWPPLLEVEHQTACDELHRLRDGLPHTADGVPIVLGMVVEVLPELYNDLPNHTLVVTGFGTSAAQGQYVQVCGAWALEPSECYSTVTAAMRADAKAKRQ